MIIAFYFIFSSFTVILLLLFCLQTVIVNKLVEKDFYRKLIIMILSLCMDFFNVFDLTMYKNMLKNSN